MQFLYKQMINIYGTLEKACSPLAQKETTPEDCIANWTCYKSGTGEQHNADTKIRCATVCERF